MFHHRYLSFMAFLLVMILALSACVPIQAPEADGEEMPERGVVESAFTVGQAVAVTEEGNDPKIWRYGTIIQVEGDGVAVQFFVDGNERWMPGQTSTHPAHDGWVMSLAEAASQGIEIVEGPGDTADGAYAVGQTVAVTEEGNDPKIWRYGTIVLVEGDAVAVGFFVDGTQEWMPGQTSTHPANDSWVMSLEAAAAQGIEIVDGTGATADSETASTDTADEEVPERGAVESAYTVGQAVAVTEEGNDPKIWRYGTIIQVEGDGVAVQFFVDGTEEWMPGQTSTHPAHDGWVMSLEEAASQGIEIVNGANDTADGEYTVGQTVAVTEEGNDPKIWRYGTIVLVEGDGVAVGFFVDGTQEWMPGQTSTHPAHDGWVMSLEEAAAQGIEIVEGTGTTADSETASTDTVADEDDGPPERGNVDEDDGPPERGTADDSSDHTKAVAGCEPLETVSAEEKELFNRINHYRVENSVACLIMSDKLNKAAKVQADYVVNNNDLSHTGTDASGNRTHICDRQYDEGYYGAVALENVTMGSSTPAGHLDSWKGSDGHRRTILNQNGQSKYAGIAINGNVAVQTFNEVADGSISQEQMAKTCLLSTPNPARYEQYRENSVDDCAVERAKAQPPADDGFAICQEIALKDGDKWYKGRIIDYDPDNAAPYNYRVQYASGGFIVGWLASKDEFKTLEAAASDGITLE